MALFCGVRTYNFLHLPYFYKLILIVNFTWTFIILYHYPETLCHLALIAFQAGYFLKTKLGL